MSAGALFPVLLVAHICLALGLFVPAFLLPFTLRTRGRDGEALARPPGRVVRGLLWLETDGTLPIAAGVALTGVALLAAVGWASLSQPWLLLALAIYVAVLIAAFFVERPALQRLLRRPAASDEVGQERWRSGARRLRYLSYLMAGAIGLIGWLMMAKPGA